ncbi:hypothetical protein BH11PLA2_BH11PLA2_09530 [soil metagenome]
MYTPRLSLGTLRQTFGPRLAPYTHHLERLGFLAYLALLTMALVKLAALRPLWYDELFTLHLARVASLPDLFGHLAAGVDLNPPFTYILTRFSILLFGEAEWAVRLPAILGLLLGLTCFYSFLHRRLGFWPAMLAVTVVVAPIKVWTYFLEARPYGLAFGFSALALLCWQRCGDDIPRRRWLFGLAMAAILGISTHYYFAVTLAALGYAELIRWAVRRKVDAWPMLAMAMGGVALAAWYPLWSVAPRDYSAGFWAKVMFTRGTIEDTYLSFFDKTAMLPLLIAIAAGVLAPLAPLRGEGLGVRGGPALRLEERVALVALLAGPVLGVALGSYLTGGFFYRYVLPASLGFAGLFALLLHRASSSKWPLVLATFAFISFGITGGTKQYREFFQHEKNLVAQLHTVLNQHCGHNMVIIETGFEFARAWHYDTGREYEPVFLADAERARYYTQVDTTERAVQLLKRVTPVPAVTSDEVITTMNSGKAVYYYGPATAWGYKDLTARGIAFDIVAERPDGSVYRLRKN